MKTNKSNTVFICQITENALKVLKCVNNNNRFFSDAAVEAIVSDKDDAELAKKINSIFKKLNYNNNPIIISIPRNNATLRFLKIPTQDPGEIEKISSLQASKYLPYLAHELITGYELIENDSQGYAQINLIIAHKGIIERYLKIFRGLKPEGVSLALSSFGIANLLDHIEPQYRKTLLAIDIDSAQAELAIISNGKLLFCRYAKLNLSQPGWEGLLLEEIDKTKNAYLKEVQKALPEKTVVLSMERSQDKFSKLLTAQENQPIEFLSYRDKVSFSDSALNSLSGTNYSFANLIGLGLRDFEETLNLVPQDLKAEKMKKLKRTKSARLALSCLGIIIILGLAVQRNLSNKEIYLKRLESELNKISAQAKPLEEIERRVQLLDKRSEKRLSGLDVLRGISQAIPEQISLQNFTYEDDDQVFLRGQAGLFNSVFDFVAQLEKLPVFRNFNVKVRYATQRKTSAGDIIDFEILCMRRK